MQHVWKLLDTIGRLLTPYHPSGRQDQRQNIDDINTPTLLAISMTMAMGRYNTVHTSQWIKLITRSHWTPPLGKFFLLKE
jgi:hypothetical protein